MPKRLRAKLRKVARLVRDRGIDADEHVIFFPGDAYPAASASAWHVPVHGWIYEPRFRSNLEEAAERLVEVDGNELEDDPGELFKRRIRMFLVDNEGGERVEVSIEGRARVALPASGKDGHFHETVLLEDLSVAGRDPWIGFQATSEHEDRTFHGRARLLGSEGVSVVSDIDDTIKDSNVLDRSELVRNTLYRPFAAVGSMPELYRAWSEAGAAFHYVSGSPWQLYPAISGFIEDVGLPGGSFEMKRLRWRPRSIIEFLAADQEATKRAGIEPLLTGCSGRSFVLVGDSGEADAAIYAELYARFSDRIRKIYIRDVGDAERREAAASALARVPEDVKMIFTDPEAVARDAEGVLA